MKARRMELLLKRSQISVGALEGVLSRFYEIRRVRRGRREWIEGMLRSDDPLSPLTEGTTVSLRIPYRDTAGDGPLMKILSRLPATMYRVSLVNVELPIVISIVQDLQRLGADVGFVEDASAAARRTSPLSRGECFRWPGTREAQLSTARELHGLYSAYTAPAPLIDLDFFTLSLRSIWRRKLRTFFLVLVLSLVCANFIQHVTFYVSEGGAGLVVTKRWELPLAAGLMALIIYMNLMEISLYERLIEIGTIRALGAETTTTLEIFAAEGIIIGTVGAMLGYIIVVVGNVLAKLGGIAPEIDLASACGPGKAILGLFLGLTVGLIGSVLPVVFVVWRPPEKCLKGPK